MDSGSAATIAADTATSVAVCKPQPDQFGSVQAQVGPVETRHSQNGWNFYARRGPVSGECERESLTHKLFHSDQRGQDASEQQDPESASTQNVSTTCHEIMPEAFFGDNLLQVSNPDLNFVMTFSPLDALKGSLRLKRISGCRGGDDVTKEFIPETPPVSNYATWQRKVDSLSSTVEINEVSSPMDWTFSTNYCGTLSGQSDFAAAPTASKDFPTREDDTAEDATSALPPTSLLTDTSIPIRWYQQVDLFEDDLGDCGLSRMDVKVRVMPEFFYILMKQVVRIDRVLQRQIETRCFHSFGSDHIVRDFQWIEAPCETPEASLGVDVEPNGIRPVDITNSKYRTTTKIKLY